MYNELTWRRQEQSKEGVPINPDQSRYANSLTPTTAELGEHARLTEAGVTAFIESVSVARLF